MKAISLIKNQLRIKKIINCIYGMYKLDISETQKAIEFIHGMVFVSKLSNVEIAKEFMEVVGNDMQLNAANPGV